MAIPTPEGGQQGGHLQARRPVQIAEGFERSIRLLCTRRRSEAVDKSTQVFQIPKIRQVVVFEEEKKKQFFELFYLFKM